MGVINEFGLRWFASFTDALAARKKSATKSFPFLAAGSIFWSISRVMGVINEFG